MRGCQRSRSSWSTGSSPANRRSLRRLRAGPATTTPPSVWPTSKRAYRFLENERFNHRLLLKGLYGVAQTAVAEQRPAYLVVAVDPVNFEKPYTQHLEGVSIVHKSTPPDLNGEARLAHGYPAITATIVNLKQPAVKLCQLVFLCDRGLLEPEP